jgi:phosphatidylglycerophosphate synthase
MKKTRPEPIAFDFKKTLKKNHSAFNRKMSFIDNTLNRPLAALIVRAVSSTRITPNHLTYISTLFGLTAAVLFSRGTHFYFILGGILAQLSSIVDGADGMLARLRNSFNHYGAHLDLMMDRVVDFFLFLGIAWGASLAYQNHRLLLLGGLAAGLYMLEINIYFLTNSLRQQKQTGDSGASRAILYWVIFILALIGRMDIFILAGLGTIIIIILVRLIVFFRLGKNKTG